MFFGPGGTLAHGAEKMQRHGGHHGRRAAGLRQFQLGQRAVAQGRALTALLARHAERQIAAGAQVGDVFGGQATGAVGGVGAGRDAGRQFTNVVQRESGLRGNWHGAIPSHCVAAARL